MMLEQLDIHMQKKINLDIDFTSFIKINSKWIIDLNVKCKTLKLLEDNKGKNLDNLVYGDDFLGKTPKIQFMEEIIDKLAFIKI